MLLLRKMPQQRLWSDKITYSSAIKACGDGEAWEQALLLLCEMPQQRLWPARGQDQITVDLYPDQTPQPLHRDALTRYPSRHASAVGDQRFS